MNFVDVLFALVIGRVLDSLTTYSKLGIASWFHLAVATTLTLTSWIGYHNSSNRPMWLIKFFNVPLWLFAFDILMVVAYWFTAITAETPGRLPTIRPEAILVAISFLLYCAWDSLNDRIRQDEDYLFARVLARQRELLPDSEALRRIRVTRTCAAVAIALAIVATVLQSHNGHVPTATAVGIDSALIVLLVGYRAAKDFRSQGA